MSTLLPTDIKKIGIFRALNLGDMLCSVPVFRSLRQAFPLAEITLISLPWADHFSRRFSAYLDRFIPFPGFPGLPEQEIRPAVILSFLQDMQEEKFDLVLQLQGDGTFVNPMISLFGPRYFAGFYLPGDYKPTGELLFSYRPVGHEIERQLALIRLTGIAVASTELEFPTGKPDEDDLINAGLSLPPKFFCIHPGSKAAWRQWPLIHFAFMGNLFLTSGIGLVITGGKDEIEMADRLNKMLGGRALVASGKTSLGAMAVLLKKSAGLLSNCTGVSHLAAALKVPSVIISMDGEPERWAPLDHSLHTTIDWTADQDLSRVKQACLALVARVVPGV